MADPTAALLWAACRPALDTASVRAAVASGADLAIATDLAIAQRVSPLLWRALQAAALDDATTPSGLAAERDSARCFARSRMVLPRVGELALAPLAEAGLEALVIKGAALAGRYPDPGLRPMDDVDLVLPDAQIDAACAALGAAGWALHPTTERRPHELQLVHAALPGLHIDLHRSLGTWRSRANRLTTDWLWAERRATTLYDAPAFVLPTDLELVMLAAHAGKPWHVFDRLIWVVDLAVVITSATPAWDRVETLSGDAAGRTALAVGLSQARRLGAESPERLRSIEAPWRAHALAPLLSADWPTQSHDGHARASARYALVDERRARLRLLAGELAGTTARGAPRRAVRLARRARRQFAARRGARLS